MSAIQGDSNLLKAQGAGIYNLLNLLSNVIGQNLFKEFSDFVQQHILQINLGDEVKNQKGSQQEGIGPMYSIMRDRVKLIQHGQRQIMNTPLKVAETKKQAWTTAKQYLDYLVESDGNVQSRETPKI